VRIIEPTLLLDEKKCQENINFMVQKAKRSNVIFRPHFKTHQSIEVGRWFRAQGVDKITVSSLRMAKYFADDGWKDITVAFPVNILEIDRINDLSRKIKLNLLVESSEVVRYLDNFLKGHVGVFIKIDTGYHRTGLGLEEVHIVDEIIELIDKSEKLTFEGFLTHAGHTYRARGKGEVVQIYVESLEVLNHFKERYMSRFPQIIISYGDTPSCSLLDSFEGVDEIRPGNFVFYDVMQWVIGSCDLGRIAVSLACPVVAKHPSRREIVVYGGAVHLSKEKVKLSDGTEIYGLLVYLADSGWILPEQLCPVVSVSQEHGVIRVDENTFAEISVGDVVGVLPVHSCLTANLMKFYITLDGKVLEQMCEGNRNI